MAKLKRLGRPRKWEDPEKFLEACDQYIDSTDEPTVAGLCAHLGITRETLSQYRQDEERGLSDAVKVAKMHIESVVERRLLYGTQATGAIFWLKNNAGYRDQKEIGSIQGQPLEIVLSKEDQGLC